MKRRLFRRLLLAGWLALGTVAPLGAAELPFDFEVLQFKAKTLASQPYVARASKVPKSLEKLTYDQHREIRFVPDRTWWRREKLPFQIDFFHPGFIFNHTVQVSELVNGMAAPIAFDSKMYEYGRNQRLNLTDGSMGFTGLRVLTTLAAPPAVDELAVFQGASYFRAIGLQQRYGLSARGLALNTGEPTGEEFPIFEEFWVEKPTADSKEAIVFALMDSPSVAGAYRFAVRPGPAAVMEVKAALYVRAGAAIKSFGVAPLTSMFWHGESSATVNNDYRPEVHDSDGLLMERGNGEWLWRPLTNPKAIRSMAFADESPKGFGLVQRDRRFASYEDLEACYHLRPSAWVQPKGSWGRGQVRLVELPTPDETNDNIVAFWVPEQTPVPGRAYEFAYQLSWFVETQPGAKVPPGGTAVATRLGRSQTHEPDLQRFVVDFDGPLLNAMSAKTEVKAMLSVGEGATLVHQGIQKNPFNGTWRVAFALRADGSGQPVELRCFLQKAPNILSETWSYLWQP